MNHYRLHQRGACSFVTFPQLEKYPELKHLFTTRLGGVSEGCCSSWNFGAKSLDKEENIVRNYEILAEVLGIPTEQMVTSAQTHTTNIRVVTAEDGGTSIIPNPSFQDVDGLVTDEKHLAIITSHADCNPVYFYDPVKQVIGLAHSGWKGTLGGISEKMVALMRERYGCRPADILAGMGPALCQDCFEVDRDVADMFFGRNDAYRQFAYERGIKTYIDLKQIIRYDLLEAGLVGNHILDMELCTKENMDLFFSHRGQQGKRGIMAAVMMLV
ncbi:MAG: peptidoglycan editing factor PgeF [Firmicutes bacterium]|nr:peptidoglycan editing factor PgeF [Bacillota bacterium]